MVERDTARSIALALPHVTDDGERLAVSGRQFAWAYSERIHHKEPKTVRPDVLVVLTASLDDKEAFLSGEPDLFFTTDHYKGYPAVLVRLDMIDEQRLAELLTDAHATAVAKGAPKRRQQKADRLT